MAPQIQRARAALRAIHRMDALMRASQEAQQDLEAGQQPAAAMQGAEDNLRQPLLETTTPEEAVAADVRTARPGSKILDSTLHTETCHATLSPDHPCSMNVPCLMPP